MSDDIILDVNLKGYVAREEVFVNVPEGKEYIGTRVTFPTGASLFLSKDYETENKERGAKASGNTSSVSCSNIMSFALKGNSGKKICFLLMVVLVMLILHKIEVLLLLIMM